MRHPARRLIGQLLMLLLLMTPVIGQALPCPMPPAHSAPDQAVQPPDGDQPCQDSAGHHAGTLSADTLPAAAADYAGPGAQAHAGMALADCLSVLAPPARTDLKAATAASVAADISGPPDLPAIMPVAHAGLSAPPPPSHPAPPASRLWADSQRLLL